MNGKALRAIGILIFISLWAALPVFAQESGPVVRRLTWEPVEYVSRYEVAVEVYTRSNTWVTVITKTTEGETFIDCPLFIGSYRFNVRVYDLLGNPGAASDWVYFELRSSREEAAAAPPDGSVKIEQAEAIEQTRELVGQISETVKTLQTDVEQLQHGETSSPPEETEKSPFRLEAVVQPLVILPFSDFNEIYATSPVQPLGVALRLSLMPIVTPLGVFGFELSPSWNFLANDILATSRYTHLATAHFSFVWQARPFGRRTALGLSAGGGMSYIQSRFDFNFGGEVQNIQAWNPSATGGVSFLVFLTKTVFVKTSIDYLHIFTRDNMTLNYLHPALGIGWWL